MEKPANNNPAPGQAQNQAGAQDNQARMELFGRLTDTLERVGNGQPRRDSYKASKYEGLGDLEYFIDQFLDVAEANDWDHDGALLHLRANLKGEAKDCGRNPTLQGVFDSLRGRFGVTPKKARTKVATIKKSAKMSSQQHADEITRLVARGYVELPERQRKSLAVETFTNSLGNA